MRGKAPPTRFCFRFVTIELINYHTAHLWVTCRRVLCEQLGETAGSDIADAALFDLTRRFGSGYTEAILALKDLDFNQP